MLFKVVSLHAIHIDSPRPSVDHTNCNRSSDWAVWVFVIVDGNVTTPRLYFKTVRESFQLIRLLVDRKVYDLIAYDVSDDRLYVQLVDSAIYYPNDRGSHDEHGFHRLLLV